MNKRLSTGVSTKRVKPVPSHLLQSGVSTNQIITPIKATTTNTTTVTTTREPTLSSWRRTKTTKGKPWIVPPLHLKATTLLTLVLSTRWRTPSKLTTCKLSRPTTRTTTSRTKPSILTSTKPDSLSAQTCTGLTGVARPAAAPAAFRSPQAGTVLTIALALGICIRGSGTPLEGWYLSLLAHSLAILSSRFLLKQNSSL